MSARGNVNDIGLMNAKDESDDELSPIERGGILGVGGIASLATGGRSRSRVKMITRATNYGDRMPFRQGNNFIFKNFLPCNHP